VVDCLRTDAGIRPSVAKEEADLRIHVHIWHDRCTISVDTSGDSLHKRGWRKYQGYAPVTETIAAAVVLNSNWDRRAPLVDPFCGSGTILMEAALIASNTAPGSFRSFGFEKWPGHKKAEWQSMLDKSRARVNMKRKLKLIGNDLDGDHIPGAQKNAASIGFAENFIFTSGDACELALTKGWGATIAANLPYGMRVGDPEELDELHRNFGACLRANCSGYNFALMVGTRQFAHLLGFQKWESLPIQNGSIPCRLLLGDV